MSDRAVSHDPRAIADAHAGDTVFVCAGTYAEGPGTPGTSALIIQKNLTIEGAGTDVVTVEPKRVGANRIAGAIPISATARATSSPSSAR